MPYYLAEVRLNKTSKNVRRERKTGKRLIKHLVTILLVCVLILTPIMIVPAAVSSDNSDVIERLRGLQTRVLALGDDAFNKTGPVEGQRKALYNKISAVIKQIDHGATEAAINKLRNDIKNAIRNWINDPWKSELIEEVDNIIDLIEGIPVADANGPYSGYEGSPITFDASGSIDNDGTIVLYEWDWNNDGTYDNSTNSPLINHTWGDDFTGTVGLRVTDDEGLTDTDTTSVTVYNVAPTVDAGLDQTVYVNQTVYFNGNFTDPGWLDTHTYFWDFGDDVNTTDTLTPTHKYTEAGVYTVTLNVTDDDGGFGTDTLKVTVSTVAVHDVAILSVTPSATKVIQGSTVNITVVVYNEGTETETFNVTAYAHHHWLEFLILIQTKTVTNLAPSNQTTLTLTWNTTNVTLGNYTISAEAIVTADEHPNDNFFIDGTVKVVKHPVADADGPYYGYEGSLITFNASGSTPDGGEIVLYEWDWDNDGAYDESTTSPIINHTWGDDFTGTVRLRVTDNDGITDTDTISVTVYNVAPTVEAGLSQTVNEGDPVSFSGSFTDPGWLDTHTIFWDFGDSINATGTLTPTHTYGDNGVYTITLNVTDNDDGVGTDSLIVTVSNVAPTAEAGLNQTVNVGETVYFNGSATDPGWLDTLTYKWDFNASDGIQVDATGQNVTHVYTESGNYTVTLTVTDDDGGVDTDELTVTVLEVAVYEFPWALYAAVGLGIAALAATAIYLWYRRRKRKSSASTAAGPSKSQTKPVVTLYIPANILAGYEEDR